MNTFIKARNPKGKDLWTRLFKELSHNNHIYVGFPVKCEKHPDATAIITQAEQFELVCPDGGCTAPWYVLRIIHLCMNHAD